MMIAFTTATTTTTTKIRTINSSQLKCNKFFYSLFRVGIEHTQGEGPGAYVTATLTKKIPETTPETHGEVSDTPAESDSDSSE